MLLSLSLSPHFRCDTSPTSSSQQPQPGLDLAQRGKPHCSLCPQTSRIFWVRKFITLVRYPSGISNLISRLRNKPDEPPLDVQVVIFFFFSHFQQRGLALVFFSLLTVPYPTQTYGACHPGNVTHNTRGGRSARQLSSPICLPI